MTDFYTNERGMPKFLRQKLSQTITPFYSWRTALLVLVFVCFQFVCLAQESRDNGALKAIDSIKPLEFGDEIPEELWEAPLQVVNHPEGKEVVTLDEYRGKLIILDFWATWCSSCIKGFSKMNDLQNAFDEEVKILAVTTQELPIVTKFFESSNGEKYNYINSVVNGGFLKKYFPHIGVPHLVWIGQDGEFISATASREFNEKNILAILDKKELAMLNKIDLDRKKPLFLAENFPEYLDMMAYTIFSKGYYSGLPTGNSVIMDNEGYILGRQITNSSIMEMYNLILSDIFRKKGDYFYKKRCVVETKNLNALNSRRLSTETFREPLFNYSKIVPRNQADSLAYYMLEELNEYSDFVGLVEKRPVECLVLFRTSSIDKIKTKGGEIVNTFPGTPSVLNNLPIAYMINRLSVDTDAIDEIIVDETNYTDNVDVKISTVKDLESLRKELKKYDLDLKPATRLIDMFVIRDK